MKRFFLILCILGVNLMNFGQEIKWLSLNEAMALQKKNPRKIVMDVYTHWCGPCKYMEQMTFENADVIKYINEKLYAVKFNAEGNEVVSYKDKNYSNPGYNPQKATVRNSVHDFALAMGISAYPTTVFFDEKGDMMFPIKGFLAPQNLELYLKLLEDNKYKEIQTNEDFQKYSQSFKPSFKIPNTPPKR